MTGGRAECPPVAADIVYQRLSALAYEHEQIARYRVAELGYKFIEHIHDETTGADAIVVCSDFEVVVAFRGTQKNYADIITDLKFKKTNFMNSGTGKELLVHRGFDEQWSAIRKRVFMVINAAAAGRRSIKATGHSLGGALAVLACLEWRLINTCITFGAPRVAEPGIGQAMRELGVRHRRYVYAADIVPIVPLMTMNYRHDCPPIYLTRAGRAIRDCPLWRESLGRARALLTVKWRAGWTVCPVPARMFTDHRIGEYGAAMARTSWK